jgi:hypothetical protein
VLTRDMKSQYTLTFVCLFDGASRHFQQYFMVAVSFSDGGKRSACRKNVVHLSLIEIRKYNISGDRN